MSQADQVDRHPEVKIYDGQNTIFAKIPYELKDKHPACGYFRKAQKLWEFPRTEYAAYHLLYPLHNYITRCDETIRNMALRYQQAQQAKNIDHLPEIAVPSLKSDLWKHQVKAHHFAHSLHGAALLMGMGVGKSITAISLLKARKHDVNLIICPKSVLTVWPHEFQKHLDENWIITAPLRKTIKERAKEARKWLEFAKANRQPYVLLINYEAFWRSDYATLLQNVHWDHIIYDECHKLKDPTSNTSKFAHKLVKNSDYRLGLTGTFLPHSPLDAFSQYKAIDPSVFGGSYYRFKLTYAQLGGFGGREVVNYINQEELNQKIESIGIQIENDVLDLPEEIHSFRTVPLETQTRRVYDDMNGDLYASVENGEITVSNAMVKVLRLQQLTSGHLKTDDGQIFYYGNEKRGLLKELLSEIPQNEPVVVFARFTPDIASIRQVAEELGRSSAELTGQANEVKDFQEGRANILATQVQAGSLGIDLTKACYCIFYSIGHSLGEYQQACKRIHRPGQTRTVRYYHLLAENTVDGRVYNALQTKQDIVEHILHGIKQEVSQEPEEATA